MMKWYEMWVLRKMSCSDWGGSALLEEVLDVVAYKTTEKLVKFCFFFEKV